MRAATVRTDSVREETTAVVCDGQREVLLHCRQSRTLSGGEIPLHTVHGDDSKRFGASRIGSAAGTGAGGGASDSAGNAAARATANRGCFGVLRIPAVPRSGRRLSGFFHADRRNDRNLSGRRYRKGVASGAVRGFGGGSATRRAQDGYATGRGAEHGQSKSDPAGSVTALRRGAVWVLRPAHRNTANCQRGDERAVDSFRARLPGAGTSRDSAGHVSGDELRKRNGAIGARGFGDLPERWIQRVAKCGGRVFRDGGRAEGVRAAAEGYAGRNSAGDERSGRPVRLRPGAAG